jgi:hypothetical protein
MLAPERTGTMSPDTETLRDDLAFMRALVSAGADQTRSFGQGYFAAGLIYGAQMLLHAAQFAGLLPSDAPWGLAIGLGPTLVFLPVIVWITVRARAERAGSTGRAVGAVFAAAGAANLALIAVIGLVAWQERSLTTWLIFPCSVYVLQGAAWLVVWTLRRRLWLALVAVGWFVAAIAMAANILQIGLYLTAAALGIWLCMALPGLIMMRAPPAGGA